MRSAQRVFDLEGRYRIYYAAELAKTLPKDKVILVNLSGRGDKDIETVSKALEEKGR